MSKKKIALEMQSARQSTTTDQFTENPRGLRGVATLTKVGLQTGSILGERSPFDGTEKVRPQLKERPEEIQQLITQ